MPHHIAETVYGVSAITKAMQAATGRLTKKIQHTQGTPGDVGFWELLGSRRWPGRKKPVGVTASPARRRLLHKIKTRGHCGMPTRIPATESREQCTSQDSGNNKTMTWVPDCSQHPEDQG